MIVFITGAPRSGTSVTTQILKGHNFWTGPLNALYENQELRERIPKSYLKRHGYDPMARYKLPDPSKQLPPYPGLREDFFKIVRRQGYTDSKDLLYKCVKFCLIWPLVHEHFPEAKWIIIRRPKNENLESCQRTSWMRKAFQLPGMSPSVMWPQWYDKHTSMFPEMSKFLDTREIHPRKFIDGDLSELQEVLAWLGRTLKPQVVSKAIDPKLYRK